MLFDSPVYFLFLILAVVVYWRLGWRKQNLFLLAASYFFYGWWDWRFLSLILISTVVDFFCAKAISSSANQLRRKSLLTLSVTLNLAFLGFFKYFDFFIDSTANLLATIGIDAPRPLLQILLPPGISFYTFQALAYIVDVYFRKMEAAENFVDYALFISFFPHLIAGPIQRPSHLLPQTQHPRTFNDASFFSGLQLIAFGLFRKCVIADNCALLANASFSGQLGPSSLPVLVIGTYAFAWQIYGDFSGYSDIARGSAQLLGFHFMVNFRQPYLARSLQEFWRRWHISLSTWLRDYLYIPLGGNRNGERQTHRNLLLTMVIGGLWHGANWTFVVWGSIHGAVLAVERLVGRIFAPKSESSEVESPGNPLTSPRAWIQRLFFFHLVCLTWIFFRAQSLREASKLLASAANWSWQPKCGTALLFLAVFSIPMFTIDILLEARQEEYPFEKSSQWFRVATAGVFLVLVTWFSANQSNAFIYFQF